jgi:cytochrome c5
MKEMTLMKMTIRLAAVLVGAAVLGVTGAGLGRATAQEMDAETKARVERFEKGPATVDVSKYPQVIQDNYELFSHKCSQCHKLSLPINSDYALPDEWSRYIKRMMYKPGSNISAADGKKIYEFLVYDASLRKKTMVDDKLAKATPAEKAAAETKIKELHDKYDAK